MNMQVLPPSTRSCKASPLHEFSKTISKEEVPEHRASLEKDVSESLNVYNTLRYAVNSINMFSESIFECFAKSAM